MTKNCTNMHTPALWFQFSIDVSNLNTEPLCYQQGIFLLYLTSQSAGFFRLLRNFLTPFSHQKVGGGRGQNALGWGGKQHHPAAFSGKALIRQPLMDWSSLNVTPVSNQVFIEECRKFEFKAFGSHNARLQMRCWRAEQAENQFIFSVIISYTGQIPVYQKSFDGSSDCRFRA